MAGKAATHGVVHKSKAAHARRTCADGGGPVGRGHGDGRPDEGVDGGVISKDAGKSFMATHAWLGRALLQRLQGGEPVFRRGDKAWGRSRSKSRRRGEEGDEVVRDEVPVRVRDGKLAWAGGLAIDDGRDVDVKRGEALSTRIEQAISGQD